MEFKTKKDIYEFILKNYSIINQENDEQFTDIDPLDTSLTNTDNLSSNKMLSHNNFNKIFYNLRNQWYSSINFLDQSKSINNYSNQFILIETNPDILSSQNKITTPKKYHKIIDELKIKYDKTKQTNQHISLNINNIDLEIKNPIILSHQNTIINLSENNKIQIIKFISENVSIDDLIKEIAFIKTICINDNVINCSEIGQIKISNDKFVVGFYYEIKQNNHIQVNDIVNITDDNEFIKIIKNIIKEQIEYFNGGFIKKQLTQLTQFNEQIQTNQLFINYSDFIPMPIEITIDSKQKDIGIYFLVQNKISLLNDIFNECLFIFINRIKIQQFQQLNLLRQILKEILMFFIATFIETNVETNLKTIPKTNETNFYKLLWKSAKMIINKTNVDTNNNLYDPFYTFITIIVPNFDNALDICIKQIMIKLNLNLDILNLNIRMNDTLLNLAYPNNLYNNIILPTTLRGNKHLFFPHSEELNKIVCNLLIHSILYINSEYYEKLIDLYLFIFDDNDVTIDVKEGILIKIYFPLIYHDDKLISLLLQLYHTLNYFNGENFNKTIFDINQILDNMIENDSKYVENKISTYDAHLNYVSYINYINETFVQNINASNEQNLQDNINTIKTKFNQWIDIWQYT
jgi:hypothetical protein